MSVGRAPSPAAVGVEFDLLILLMIQAGAANQL